MPNRAIKPIRNGGSVVDFILESATGLTQNFTDYYTLSGLERGSTLTVSFNTDPQYAYRLRWTPPSGLFSTSTTQTTAEGTSDILTVSNSATYKTYTLVIKVEKFTESSGGGFGEPEGDEPPPVFTWEEVDTITVYVPLVQAVAPTDFTTEPTWSEKDASSGNAYISTNPVANGTPTPSSYSYESTDTSIATVQSSTGTITWTENPSSTSRSVDIRVYATNSAGTYNETFTASQQAGPGGSFSYGNAPANGGTVAVNNSGLVGTTSNWRISGTGATIDTAGTLTWESLESSDSRNVTVTVAVTKNGVTKDLTTTATQNGGASISSFSYTTASAAGGKILAFSSSTASSVSFSVANAHGVPSSQYDLDTNTGDVTWEPNESASSRQLTIRLTASRNGDTDTKDAVSLQQGGTQVSIFSYADKNATAGAGSPPTLTATSGSTVGTYSVTGSGATIDATTGVLTWTANTSSSSRTVTVNVTVSRNGDSDTVSATATQLGKSEITSFSYATRNASAGSVSPSIVTAGGTNSYSIVGTSPSYVTLNTTTGVLTWLKNEAEDSRTVTVKVISTRNGTTSSSQTTATQSGGTELSDFSYPVKDATSGEGSSPNLTVTSGTNVSYSLIQNTIDADIDSTTGVITWPANSTTESRTVKVRATGVKNTDTDTIDVLATQQGGTEVTTFTYPSVGRNANTGTVTPTIDVEGTTSFSRTSGSTGASVNSSTGVVTWTNNDTTSDRSAVITMTVTRNGASESAAATVKQKGGPGVSGTYVYPIVGAPGGTTSPAGSPTFTGTEGTWSVSGAGASINSSGVITWSNYIGTSSRSVTVRRNVTRNGYTRTLTVGTATQNKATSQTGFKITPSLTSPQDAPTEVRFDIDGWTQPTGPAGTTNVTHTLSVTASSGTYVTLLNTAGNSVGNPSTTANINDTHFLQHRNQDATVIYTATVHSQGDGPSPGQGEPGEPIDLGTATATVSFEWEAVPPSALTRDPSWNIANASANATASINTTALANGVPAPSIRYSTTSTLVSVNSVSGALTWTRNPGSTERTAEITVTADNSSNGGGEYIHDSTFTVAQKAGPEVSFSYPVNKNATSGDQAVTESHVGTATYTISNYNGISSSDVSVDNTTGIVTWAKNENATDRSVVVTASVTNNGDTRTGTASATQLGGVEIGSFSYTDINAAGGTSTPSVDVTPDSVLGFRITTEDPLGVSLLSEETGELEWDLIESENPNIISVELTASRNGVSKVAVTNAQQLGGVEINSFSYASIGAASESVSPIVGITEGATKQFSLISGDGISNINTETGEITWSNNLTEEDREASIMLSASRNGDTDTLQAVATQTAQNITASITGPTSVNSNYVSTFSGSLSGLTEGVTASGYAWSISGATIISGQNTNQIQVEWGGTSDFISSINLTITDSLGRTYAANTYNVSVTNVADQTPITEGTEGYGLEFFNQQGQAVLRLDEVFTQFTKKGVVGSTGTAVETLANTTEYSEVLVTLEGTEGAATYTVTGEGSTRTVTITAPENTAYTITVAR